MMVMLIIMVLILIGAGQLLFTFINAEDEATASAAEYKFNMAKLNCEDINIFALGDKYPPSRSVYRVDFRKGVI